MRKIARIGSPTSGIPASAKAVPTAPISARNGASTSVSYTALRGLNQTGSLFLRSPRKKLNAAGRNPANEGRAVFIPRLYQATRDPAASPALPGVDQEFAVASRPGDRAVGDPDDLPAGLRPWPAARR